MRLEIDPVGYKTPTWEKLKILIENCSEPDTIILGTRIIPVIADPSL